VGRGSEIGLSLSWLYVLQAEGYDPTKSKVSNNTMEVWKNADVKGDLKQVPGIGAAAVDKLGAADVEENERITNTHQLIGKYLMLKGPGDVTFSELNQKFWYFLKAKGITAHRSAIVLAISDKVSAFFPGFHDGSEDFEYDDQ
jgi:hypothetical protein